MDEQLDRSSTSLERDREYRDLLARHRAFEFRLAELAKRPYLGADEELERSRIKKRKLVVKDRMRALTAAASRVEA